MGSIFFLMLIFIFYMLGIVLCEEGCRGIGDMVILVSLGFISKIL